MIRCKHNMVAVACAFCAPPRIPNVPSRRQEATTHAAAAVAGDTLDVHGIVVVHTSGGSARADISMREINSRTRTVHINGTPFLWAINEILRRGQNIKVIQMIPSMLPKCRQGHINLCTARGVDVRGGHIRPDLVWEDGRAVSRHYDAQRRFMAGLSGPQKVLFDELLAFGFDAAAMAKRYYRLDESDGITQAKLAAEFGLNEADNARVSGSVLAVLYYLDSTTRVGDVSERRARAMRKTVERLRPFVASIEHRATFVAELGLTTLAAEFPMARAETLRMILATVRDGRIDALRLEDPRGVEAITLRFGLDELERGVYRKLVDVGTMMGGISRERVRQLEERALATIGIVEDW